MQNRTCRKWVYLIFGMAFLLIPGQALAKDGWYMGMDFGVAVSAGPNTRAYDNDHPTACDQFIVDPLEIGFGTTLDPTGHRSLTNPLTLNADGEQCANSNERWTNKFDGGTGVLAGLAVGYRWQNLRVEGEYFFRNADHDGSSVPNFGGYDNGDDDNNQLDVKVNQEIAVLGEGIDDVLSHNFFANLYYDFALNPSSKWTPYLGVGVGFAKVAMDYFNRYTRATNPADIETFNAPEGTAGTEGYVPGYDLANLGDINRDGSLANTATHNALNNRLAGTTTFSRSDFSDTLFGYQLIAGVDYRVSDPVTIGLKFRWVDLGEFEDSSEYTQLRSHDSTNSLAPGTPRVRYNVAVDDIQFWGLSLNMKYHF